jgi:hypothetical protein
MSRYQPPPVFPPFSVDRRRVLEQLVAVHGRHDVISDRPRTLTRASTRDSARAYASARRAPSHSYSTPCSGWSSHSVIPSHAGAMAREERPGGFRLAQSENRVDEDLVSEEASAASLAA